MSEQGGARLGARVRQRRRGQPGVARGLVQLHGGQRGARAVEGALAHALAVAARRHQHAVRRARRAARARRAQARHVLPRVLPANQFVEVQKWRLTDYTTLYKTEI